MINASSTSSLDVLAHQAEHTPPSKKVSYGVSSDPTIHQYANIISNSGTNVVHPIASVPKKGISLLSHSQVAIPLSSVLTSLSHGHLTLVSQPLMAERMNHDLLNELNRVHLLSHVKDQFAFIDSVINAPYANADTKAYAKYKKATILFQSKSNYYESDPIEIALKLLEEILPCSTPIMQARIHLLLAEIHFQKKNFELAIARSDDVLKTSSFTEGDHAKCIKYQSLVGLAGKSAIDRKKNFDAALDILYEFIAVPTSPFRARALLDRGKIFNSHFLYKPVLALKNFDMIINEYPDGPINQSARFEKAKILIDGPLELLNTNLGLAILNKLSDESSCSSLLKNNIKAYKVFALLIEDTPYWTEQIMKDCLVLINSIDVTSLNQYEKFKLKKLHIKILGKLRGSKIIHQLIFDLVSTKPDFVDGEIAYLLLKHTFKTQPFASENLRAYQKFLRLDSVQEPISVITQQIMQDPKTHSFIKAKACYQYAKNIFNSFSVLSAMLVGKYFFKSLKLDPSFQEKIEAKISYFISKTHSPQILSILSFYQNLLIDPNIGVKQWNVEKHGDIKTFLKHLLLQGYDDFDSELIQFRNRVICELFEIQFSFYTIIETPGEQNYLMKILQELDEQGLIKLQPELHLFNANSSSNKA